jgi:hypothetical protein
MSCYETCEVCGGTTRIPLTVHSSLLTLNHQIKEWWYDIKHFVRWNLYRKHILIEFYKSRWQLSICDKRTIKKALRVALANVEDPMAGQGDLYAAALEILEKKK